jgi:hypothetical protein
MDIAHDSFITDKNKPSVTSSFMPKRDFTHTAEGSVNASRELTNDEQIIIY